MFQPAAAKASRVEPEIEINGCKLNVVNQFTYLGSIMSDDCKIDKEIEARIKKASASYGRLTDRVWENRAVKLKTKIAVYKAVVMSTLLYGCETWTCHQRHVKMLDRFHLRHLRFILRTKWQAISCQTPKYSADVKCRESSPSCFDTVCAGRATSCEWTKSVCQEKSSYPSSTTEPGQ